MVYLVVCGLYNGTVDGLFGCVWLNNGTADGLFGCVWFE